MKAVILTTEIDKNMEESISKKPKCFFEIGNGETVLSWQIIILKKCGIKNFIIITGTFSDEIESYVNRKFPDINAEFVRNSFYESTNYIYSLYLSQKYMDDDIFLIYGDVIADIAIFQELINSSAPNSVLVDENVFFCFGNMKAEIQNGVVKRISPDILDEDGVYILPCFKISKSAMQIWITEINNFIWKGRGNVFAEEALNNRFNEILLFPTFLQGRSCVGIRNENDLEIIKQIIEN